MSRRRYKRKSNFNELFDLLFDLTGFVWQIGAVVSGVLLFLSYIAYDWADTWIAAAEKSPFLSPIATNFGWAAYLLPLMFVVLAALFGVKTYETYRNEHF
jgi:hypothetical protein